MTELIAEISKLSVADRIALVQAILQTIAAEGVATENFEPSKQQKAELEKRSASVANGKVMPVSWESIQAKLTERYGLPD